MWSGAGRGKGEKVVGSLGPGRRKGRIPKIKAVRKTSGAVEGFGQRSRQCVQETPVGLG